MDLDADGKLATWLMDFVAEVPSTVKVHGMDIEGKRFPQSHPDNVSFSVGSVLSLPQDWTSKFDLVHQRLVMAALRREDWPVAIGEIHRVLKPGGWVQLGEYGFWGFNIGPWTDKLFRLYSLLYKQNGLVLRVHAEIPDMLREAGFTSVNTERRGYPWGGAKGKEGRDCLVEHFRSVKAQIMRFGGLGLVKSDDEIEELILNMEKEVEHADGAEAEIMYTWAQKA